MITNTVMLQSFKVDGPLELQHFLKTPPHGVYF